MDKNNVRLIEANALKEDLKNMLARVIHESDLDFDHSHAKIWTATITGIQHSIKRLDNAHTIDAVPVVHGRWSEPFIGGYDGFHAVYYMTCSKCMREVQHSIFRYCPNCGAKMNGGGNID